MALVQPPQLVLEFFDAPHSPVRTRRFSVTLTARVVALRPHQIHLRSDQRFTVDDALVVLVLHVMRSLLGLLTRLPASDEDEADDPDRDADDGCQSDGEGPAT